MQAQPPGLVPRHVVCRGGSRPANSADPDPPAASFHAVRYFPPARKSAGRRTPVRDLHVRDLLSAISSVFIPSFPHQRGALRAPHGPGARCSRKRLRGSMRPPGRLRSMRLHPAPVPELTPLAASVNSKC